MTINKGLATEKTVKCTNPVEASGIKVSGCTCTTPSTSVVVSSSKPKDVTWSVSGCTGAEPFTYAWAGGASGTEASATLTIKSVGAYAPTVTVTNSDGMTMSPTCNSVSASELPGAACNVGEHNYDANNSATELTAPTDLGGVSLYSFRGRRGSVFRQRDGGVSHPDYDMFLGFACDAWKFCLVHHDQVLRLDRCYGW